jgi:hypothetical protein
MNSICVMNFDSMCRSKDVHEMHKEGDKVSDMPFENKSMARPLGDQGALNGQ